MQNIIAWLFFLLQQNSESEKRRPKFKFADVACFALKGQK